MCPDNLMDDLEMCLDNLRSVQIIEEMFLRGYKRFIISPKGAHLDNAYA